MPSSPRPPSSLVAAVHEAGWVGQHLAAIELATQALGQPDLAPAEQMDLLDLRAESYVAQGQLDRAAQDVDAMLALAHAAADRALEAQALNRQVLVQMRSGALTAAVQTAAAAVAAAQGVPALHAASLLRLAEAQMRHGQRESGLHRAGSRPAYHS